MHIPRHITRDLIGVSESTLADWRAGRRKPGPVAARLLELYSDRRVMPDDPAWIGWGFQGRFLETSSGDTVSPAELDNIRVLRVMLENAFVDHKALKKALADQDEYIKYLEGANAPANAARLSNP